MQSYDNTNVYNGVFEGGCTLFPATDQDYNVKPGQIYRHFKGGFYRILQVAQHESKQGFKTVNGMGELATNLKLKRDI